MPGQFLIACEYPHGLAAGPPCTGCEKRKGKSGELDPSALFCSEQNVKGINGVVCQECMA